MRWSAADLADEIDFLDEPELLEIIREWRDAKARLRQRARRFLRRIWP